MNIDEHKMVLETINNTTGLAKHVGTIWIWLHYGFKVVVQLIMLSVLSVFAYTVWRVVLTLGGKDTRFMRLCRDRLGIGCQGVMTESEYERTTERIMDLIDKHNKEKRA